MAVTDCEWFAIINRSDSPSRVPGRCNDKVVEQRRFQLPSPFRLHARGRAHEWLNVMPAGASARSFGPVIV